MSAALSISRLRTRKGFAGARLVLLAGAALILLQISSCGRQSASLPVMAEHPIRHSGSEFYVQKFEVTVAEWNACHEAGGCALKLRTPAEMAAEQTPATGLSHEDVEEYVDWISRSTGHEFRLPTVAEWKAMAAPILSDAPDPTFTDASLRWASTYRTENNAPRELRPRGSFSQTSEGIADLDGSVWEWTQDCYGGPAGGNVDAADCISYWAAGEHAAALFSKVRDPARGGCAVGTPPAHLGMRLVTDSRVASM